jgi:hypothetical protein
VPLSVSFVSHSHWIFVQTFFSCCCESLTHHSERGKRGGGVREILSLCHIKKVEKNFFYLHIEVKFELACFSKQVYLEDCLFHVNLKEENK